MNNLIRRDPFREMLSLRRTMDHLLDSAFFSPQLDWENDGMSSMSMALDVSENEDGYQVKASLPGIHPDDLEITYNNNTLTIRGEVKEEQETEEARYHLRERRFGRFSRSIALPTPIKAEEIQANYDAGVLKLSLPKAEEARPRRISIQTDKNRVIEG